MDKAFFYSFDGENFYNMTYESEEEVFEEVLSEYRPAFESGEMDGVWIGTGIKAQHPEISAENVLEWMRNDAGYDDFDGFTDNYLTDVPSEQLKELEELLNIAYNLWEYKHKQQPTWYEIKSKAYHHFVGGVFKKENKND